MKDIEFEELDMDSGRGSAEDEVVLEELTIDDDVSAGDGAEADASADDVFEELDIDDASKHVTVETPVVEEAAAEPEAKEVAEEIAVEPEAEVAVEEAAAEPEAEEVAEEAAVEPEAVLEEIAVETGAEPEAETVIENTPAGLKTETTVEEAVAQPETEPEPEIVVEEAAAEPETETAAKVAAAEPEPGAAAEETAGGPEAVQEEIAVETEAEPALQESAAGETPEESTGMESDQEAVAEPEAENPMAETASVYTESVAAEDPESGTAAAAAEAGLAPVDTRVSETTAEEPALAEAPEEALDEGAAEEPALTEVPEEVGSEETGPEETAAATEAEAEPVDTEVSDSAEAETDPAPEAEDVSVESGESEADPAMDRTPQVLEQRPIQPFWSVEEPEETRTPVGIVKFVSGALVFAALLAAAYVYGINYYGTHFLPNTYLDGVDVGEMTAAEAKDALRASFEDYSFTLTGRNGATEELDISEAAPAREYEGVEQVLAGQNRVGWIVSRNPVKETSLPYTGTFDEEGLDRALDQSVLLDAANITSPENAYISFDPGSNHYAIVPEVPGNAVDREILTKAMGEMLQEGKTAVDLEEIGCYIAPAVGADNPRLNADLTELNTLQDLGASIDMGGEVTESLNGEQLLELMTKEDALPAYITGLKDRYNTYDKDKKRLFKTAEGTYILMNAAYGWRLDEDATLKDLLTLTDQAADAVGRSFDPEAYEPETEAAKSSKSSKSSNTKTETAAEETDPFHITASWKNKAVVHDEKDYGPTYAEVDLTNQTVYVIQDGETIFTSPCVSGRMTKDRKTPPGIFDIKLKQTNKTLVGYKPDGSVDYRSPVNYWMPFNGGVGFHDATWRGSFGGTIYVNSGSHGCINMPLAKARELYGLVYKGMPVIVYYR